MIQPYAPFCEMPKEIRCELYANHLHLSSLARLCSVSTKFQKEITELIFNPSKQANHFCANIEDNLDNLLEYTKTCGRQIKWINLNLGQYSDGSAASENSQSEEISDTEETPLVFEESFSLVSEEPLSVVGKVINILRNCPNLACLTLNCGSDVIDTNKLFNEFNNNVLPNLVMLEKLDLKDTYCIGWWGSNNYKQINHLNIDSLSRLQKISLERINLIEGALEQIEKMPEDIDIELKIRCFTIPDYMITSFKKFKPNCTIFWQLIMANFSFPDEQLRLIQEITCPQEMFIQFGNQALNDEQILLLKQFKSLTLCPLNPCKGLGERIVTLLPEIKLTMMEVTYVPVNFCSEES